MGIMSIELIILLSMDVGQSGSLSLLDRVLHNADDGVIWRTRGTKSFAIACIMKFE
jgi:hypothetical protein